MSLLALDLYSILRDPLFFRVIGVDFGGFGDSDGRFRVLIHWNT